VIHPGVLDELEATLRNQCAFVLEVAAASPPGGGPQWDNVMSSCRVVGVAPPQRGALAGSRGHHRGAFPEEVEAVITAIAAHAAATLHAIGPWLHHHHPDLAGRLHELAVTVAGLPADRRRAYERSLTTKPAGAGVSSIFANARATAQIDPWSRTKYDSSLTLSCASCGSPQTSELSFDCKFCGNNLFSGANAE
jgi:hypothetical protein